MNNEVRLYDLSCELKDDFCMISCKVDGKGLPGELYFKVFGDVVSRGLVSSYNPFVVALVMPAMLRGFDIKAEGPVSPLLLSNLNNELQSFLCCFDHRLAPVNIQSQGYEECGDGYGAVKRVATGFSAGVDSFASLAKYDKARQSSSLQVSDICTFNVGAMGKTHKDDVREVFMTYARRSEHYAAELGLGNVSIDSNISDFYEGFNFAETHTLRNAAAALVLSDFIDVYLYSSAYAPESIGVAVGKDLAIMDPIILPFLDTEKIRFISSCSGMSRAQKTELILSYDKSYALLDVCVASADVKLDIGSTNCSKCWKCKRTLVTLDILGGLDKYSSVFDIAYFLKHKNSFYDDVAIKALAGDKIDFEVYGMARKKGYRPSFYVYIKSLILKLKMKRKFKKNRRRYA